MSDEMRADQRLDALLTRQLARRADHDADHDARTPNDTADTVDATLDPPLAAAAQLAPLRAATPRPAFAATLHADLLQRAANLASATQPSTPSTAPGAIVPIASRNTPAARLKRPLWVVAAAAILLLTLIGSSIAAADAAPGSLFFSLRRLEQNVRVSLTASAADRARLHLAYATDALAALQTAAQHGDASKYATALATLTAETQASATEITHTEGAERDTLTSQLTALQTRETAALWSALGAQQPALDWRNRLASAAALTSLGAPTPQITSITITVNSKSSAQKGAQGDAAPWQIIVTGAGFAPGAQLVIAGAPLGHITAQSSTRLVALLQRDELERARREGVGVENPNGAAVEAPALPPATPTPPADAATPGVTPTNGNHEGQGKGGHNAPGPSPSPTAGPNE